MPVRRYAQLDVFSPRPGAGNPLAVVHDGAGMDDAAMQAFAAWTNLSETIFFLPPTAQHGADYRIRIFTPKMELPFAGHPSVGAAWAALDAGLARDRDGRLVQECAAGLLPVRIVRSDGQVMPSVRSPRAQPRAVEAPGWLRAGQVWGATRGTLAPALWNNGPDWWLLGLADEAAVRGLVPDQAAVAALPGSGKLAVFAAADRTANAQLVVRAFAPGSASPKTRRPAASTPSSPRCCTGMAACPVRLAATAPARAARSAAMRACNWRSMPTARSGSAGRYTR